ncbi:hypothetical protein FCV25MIE_13943 [Fagus crenata]
MFFKFTLAFVFVLVLICLPTSQATRFLNDEKLGSVEQGQAGSPHVTNPTNPTTGTGDIASMITEKVFVTDHIDVSPFLRRLLQKNTGVGSYPNPPGYIPPKSSNNMDHPSQGSMETSKTKGSNTIH